MKGLLKGIENEIVDLYKAGLSLTEIAERFYVNRTSVARLLQKMEVTKRKDKTIEFIEDALNTSSDGCILWPYARNNNGYGEVHIDGKKRYAHRVVCTKVHGTPETPELEAAHSCGKGADGCINPKHLSWKTSKGNAEDRLLHGTNPSGSRNGHAKLSENDVIAIRALAGIKTHKQIAEEYGMGLSVIHRIMNRTIWRHI